MADPVLFRLLPAVPKGALLPAGLLALWSIVAVGQLVESPLFISPLAVVRAPFLDPDGRQIWTALGASILRIVAGGLVGAFFGLVLGAACGLLRFAALSFAPTVHSLRQIAVFAWIPLFTAWFGNGETAKLVFTALSTFFPLFLATEQGMRATPAALKEVAAVLALSRWTRLRRLYFPAALPNIQVGLQIAAMSAWIGTIGAEYAIGNGRGLGSYIASARDQFRMDIVLVGVFALAAGGVVLHRACLFLSARLSPWTKE